MLLSQKRGGDVRISIYEEDGLWSNEATDANDCMVELETEIALYAAQKAQK